LSTEQRSALEVGLRYFQEAAPKHTADEEESLFPRLRETGREDVEALMRSIDALESDHGVAGDAHRKVERLGRKWLDELRLTGPDTAQLSAQLARLAELYQRHIGIEDNEVFPAAARILTADDRKAVGAEMAARRGIGCG
jgi:hemerythrin-like domain-containing protein